jgi:hypothetical protein
LFVGLGLRLRVTLVAVGEGSATGVKAAPSMLSCST